MRTTSQPEELLSLNRLSRKLDITYAKAVELQFRGILIPDFTADHIYLFRKSRVPEIQIHLQEKRLISKP